MLAMLAAAALVVLLVVVPLLDLGDGGGGSGDLPSAEPTTPVVSPTLAPNVIPATVGLRTADAIALAREVGLNWTVQCNHDESQPEGIIDQEPAAGTPVSAGNRFTMFSARIDDCRGGDDGNSGGGNSGNSGRGNDD